MRPLYRRRPQGRSARDRALEQFGLGDRVHPSHGAVGWPQQRARSRAHCSTTRRGSSRRATGNSTRSRARRSSRSSKGCLARQTVVMVTHEPASRSLPAHRGACRRPRSRMTSSCASRAARDEIAAGTATKNRGAGLMKILSPSAPRCVAVTNKLRSSLTSSVSSAVASVCDCRVAPAHLRSAEPILSLVAPSSGHPAQPRSDAARRRPTSQNLNRSRHSRARG